MATNQALRGLDNLEVSTVDVGGSDSRAARLARRAWTAAWPKLLAIVLVLAVWQLVHLTGWKSLVLKGPGTVLPYLWNMVQHAQIWQAIKITMGRALVGYLIALVLGSVIGVLVARIPPLRAAVGSIITGLQTMPSVAWVPFAIVLFGSSNSAILFVMVMGAAPSIANGLITGIDYTPPLLLRAGRTMGLRGVTLYRFLVLPASLPAFVAGLKQGWAFAWRGLMAGELVVAIIGTPGLGVLMNTYTSLQDFAGVTSIIIVILIIGIVVDGVFTKADTALRRRRGLLDPATL
jgi:NitT/TauT family transport system permease protein